MSAAKGRVIPKNSNGRVGRDARIPAASKAPELEAILTGAAVKQRELLETLLKHREAISQADAKTIGVCVQAERRLLEELKSLDDRRRSLLGVTGSASGEQPKLRELTEGWPEPARSKLLALGEQIKETGERALAMQRTIRLASESLVRHMDGLMQQVAAKLSHAGTYGRLGRVEAGAPVMSGLDVRQ